MKRALIKIAILLAVGFSPNLMAQANTSESQISIPMTWDKFQNLKNPPPSAWSVNPSNFQYNMNILARVKVNAAFENGSQNLVGVFVGAQLRGVATPIEVAGAAYYFITVYSNNYTGEALNFQLYLQAEDKIYLSGSVASFQHNGSVGTFGSPFLVDVTAGMAVSNTGVHPSCSGLADGSISTTVWRGTAPFTYLWSNGATTQNIHQLVAGTYSLTVTDATGATATNSFTLTVADNQLPVLSIPPNQNLALTTGACTQTYTIADPISDNCSGSVWSASFSGNVNGNPVNVSNIPDGTDSGPIIFQKGTTTVTLNGVDAVSNAALSKTFTVTVNDNQPPVITCAQDITLSPSSSACIGTATLTQATVSDNCDNSVNLTNNAPATYLEGLTIVTWTATDIVGNSATCTQTVTVDCDVDNDGFYIDTDCNDGNAAIYPGATEIVGDGVDQNCDGLELCYTDADDDGARLTPTVNSADTDCLDTNEGMTDDPLDCNDADAAINPAATEIVADGTDQNCDNQELCYNDADDDSYTTANPSTIASSDLDCTDANEEAVIDAPADCNDGNANINPAATEIVADGTDQNCDNQELCYNDADDDGYTTANPSTRISTDLDCTDANEEATVDSPADCNDANASIKPTATETCANSLDDDCDGLTDEGCGTQVQLCAAVDNLIAMINALPEPPADAAAKFWLTTSLEYAKMFYEMGEESWAVTMLGPSLEYESFRYWVFYFNSANPQKLTNAQKNFLDAAALDLIAAINNNTANCGGSRPENGSATDVVEQEMTISELKMLVSPNPTAGPLTIQFFDFEKLAAGDLQVFDAAGRMVYRQTVEPGTTRLDLDLSENGLANGFYTLRMRVGEQILTRKVSVVK